MPKIIKTYKSIQFFCYKGRMLIRLYRLRYGLTELIVFKEYKGISYYSAKRLDRIVKQYKPKVELKYYPIIMFSFIPKHI